MLVKFFLKRFKIKSINSGRGVLKLTFDKKHSIVPENLVDLVINKPDKYLLTPEISTLNTKIRLFITNTLFSHF